jgi:hypothetical protein
MIAPLLRMSRHRADDNRAASVRARQSLLSHCLDVLQGDLHCLTGNHSYGSHRPNSRPAFRLDAGTKQPRLHEAAFPSSPPLMLSVALRSRGALVYRDHGAQFGRLCRCKRSSDCGRGYALVRVGFLSRSAGARRAGTRGGLMGESVEVGGECPCTGFAHDPDLSI